MKLKNVDPIRPLKLIVTIGLGDFDFQCQCSYTRQIPFNETKLEDTTEMLFNIAESFNLKPIKITSCEFNFATGRMSAFFIPDNDTENKKSYRLTITVNRGNQPMKVMKVALEIINNDFLNLYSNGDK